MSRKCFSPKITEAEKECLYSLIKIVSKIFKKNNIYWIPTGGSLLAIYRHNKLSIPWDDDYDITIRNRDKVKAIKILKTELPKFQANISFRHTWKGGLLFKIYWENNKKKYLNVIKQFEDKNKEYSWPFIDLFVDVKNDFRELGAFPLSKYDFPLKEKNIEGIKINIPTKGIRNYKSFLKKGHIHTLIEQYWSHKYEKHIPCVGPKKIFRNITPDMIKKNHQLKKYKFTKTKVNNYHIKKKKLIKKIDNSLNKINRLIKLNNIK